MQEDQLRSSRNLYAGLAMGGAAAVRGMGRVIGKAAKFGFEMRFVKEISKATREEQEKLSKQAMQLGQRTIFFAKDVAEGMRFMAMAGMGYKEVAGNISAAVQLAAAANLSIAGRGGAADIMTNVMKAYKIEAKDSAYISDILAEAATSANLNVFEMGEALKYAGSTAMDLNITLQESAAMAMTLANAGMQGSMAGVAMENSMRYLARTVSNFASGTQIRALEAAGLTGDDFQDANGNLNTMVENIAVLKRALTGMGNVQKQAILQTLFGVRGKRAGSLLMRNYEEFVTHLSRFEGAHGRAMEISKGMMDTLEGSILRVRAVFQHLGIFFTQGLQPVLRPLLWMVETLVKAMQWLFKTPILGQFLATGLAAFVTLKTIAFAYKAVVLSIRIAQLRTGGSAMVMAGQTVGAYNAMSGAAMRYGRVAGASSMMGMGGFGMMRRGMKGGGYGFSKAAFRGTGGYFVKTAGGGRQAFKTAAKARAFAAAQGGARFGGRGMMFGLSRIAAGTGARAGLAMGLGRLVGVLGGPLGLALSFVIPGLIGVLVKTLGKNRESIEDNSKALHRQRIDNIAREQQFSRMSHAVKFFDLIDPSFRLSGITQAGVTTMGGSDSSNRMGAQIIDNRGEQQIVLNINLDGETMFSQQLEDFFNKKENYANNLISVP
jgi:TP901 family phage tail tape measure protein